MITKLSADGLVELCISKDDAEEANRTGYNPIIQELNKYPFNHHQLRKGVIYRYGDGGDKQCVVTDEMKVWMKQFDNGTAKIPITFRLLFY